MMRRRRVRQHATPRLSPRIAATTSRRRDMLAASQPTYAPPIAVSDVHEMRLRRPATICHAR